MADIVERLERGVFDAETDTYVSYSLCDEAADTITTLRAEVEKFKQDLTFSRSRQEHWFKEATTLRATNERLRAALHSIAYDDVSDGMSDAALTDLMAETAHAALAQEKQ
jgi:FtsZ-binding cell division protein ZapB